MRTRPKISPSRPTLTTRTELTTRYPRIIHSRKNELPGCSGSRSMPRKMLGIAMSMIDESIVARRTPTVVFDSAIHLYRSR